MGELRLSGRRRLKGFDYVGRNAYHVATITHLRQPLLVDAIAAHAADQLRQAADRTDFELLSFVVMPDHVHILAQGSDDDANLIRFLQHFKQTTGYEYKRQTGHHLWQWSFYDRIVRKDEDIEAIAWYIVRNPERAGLVRSGDSWPLAGGTLVEEISTQDPRLGRIEATPPPAPGVTLRGAS